MKTLETQVTVFETNYYNHEMHSTAPARTNSMLKTETQSRKQVYQASFNQNPQNPTNKHSKNNQTHVRATYISNLHNNSKIKKSKAINMKCVEKIRKPILFLEDWSWDDEKMEDFCE